MKLRIKLIIAFTGIVIMMGILQSLFFHNRFDINFEDYTNKFEDQQIELWESILIDYYYSYGSWEGVQDLLTYDRHKIYFDIINGLAYRQQGLQILVVNTDGLVVGDSNQEYIGVLEKGINGINIELNIGSEKVGELIIRQSKIENLYNIEEQFKKSISTAIISGAIISVLIAIFLGVLFSNQITKPLKKLMAGIKQLGSGNTSYRVDISSSGEFSQLAIAFNEMSKQIEENEKVRKNLMADVAHELRTPLSILAGKIESIQEGVINPSQEVMAQLGDEVYRLGRLVSNLQQLSLAEAGKLPLNRIEVNLNELIEQVKNNFQWIKDEKNIDIILNSEKEFICNIDSDRFKQVIINILGNAIHYTPENGKINIIITEDILDNMAVIKISDNGPGISEDQLRHIFDRFYRTDNSRSRDEGGTGLGLSIAKGYIEAHGGKIMVESEIGKGSTFIIKIPVIN